MGKPVLEFAGYREGDITYCVDPDNNDFFPVRVVKVGRRFVDVDPMNCDLTMEVAPEFHTDKMNRRFMSPKRPIHARFGGSDERTVNTERVSGQELRLLPFHYGTYTSGRIKQRHLENAELWPLPTGIVYERWFKVAET